MSVGGLLNLTCRVRPVTETQNTTTGGITPGFPSDVSGVACAVQTMASTQQTIHAAERGTRTFDVYFRYGQTITVGDVIDQIAPGPEWSGRSLAINSPPTDDAGRKAYVRCEAVETGGGAQL